MRAYLIDPQLCSITEVEYNGDFHQIYELIDAPAFDIASVGKKGDCIYVDDEGLLKPGNCIFRADDRGLAGKGLVLGTNAEGESVEPSMTLAELRNRVVWTPFTTRGAE